MPSCESRNRLHCSGLVESYSLAHHVTCRTRVTVTLPLSCTVPCKQLLRYSLISIMQPVMLIETTAADSEQNSQQGSSSTKKRVRGGYTYCVPGCYSNTKRDHKLPFHRFPRDVVMKERWPLSEKVSSLVSIVVCVLGIFRVVRRWAR